jgi:hypothetical protein
MADNTFPPGRTGTLPEGTQTAMLPFKGTGGATVDGKQRQPASPSPTASPFRDTTRDTAFTPFANDPNA